MTPATTTLSGVYTIKNGVTGGLYVGSTGNLAVRSKVHLRLLQTGSHHSAPLQNAWNKYGSEAFTFVPLFYCSVNDLLKFEQRAMEVLGPSYNVSKVAGSPMRGRKHSHQTKQRMSEASKGRPKSDTHRQNIGLSKQGVKLSEEQKAKIRAAWVARRNKPVSEVTRKKLSEAGKGRPVSPKSLAALIAYNKERKGKKTGPMNLTEAERAKRVERNKARKGSPLRPEIAKQVKEAKQSKWSERKAKGLHTIRWYKNRGLEIPSEVLSSRHNTQE